VTLELKWYPQEQSDLSLLTSHFMLDLKSAGVATNWVANISYHADVAGHTLVTLEITDPGNDTSGMTVTDVAQKIVALATDASSALYQSDRHVSQMLNPNYKPIVEGQEPSKKSKPFPVEAIYALAGFGGLLLLLLVLYFVKRMLDSRREKRRTDKRVQMTSLSPKPPTISPTDHARQLEYANVEPVASGAQPSSPMKGQQTQSKWRTEYDANQGAYYWYNIETGQSQWESPQDA
jgi:hypothetical protein